MNSRFRWLLAVLGGVLAGSGASVAQAEEVSNVNMTRGVTAISNEVYDLHMLVLWVVVAIGVVVFGVLFYSVVKFRKSQGAVAATFHESTTVEIIWTTIPFVILVALAIPAAKTLIAMEDTSNADVSIKVTGYQWKWHYEYLDEGVDFFSMLNADHNAARKVGSGVDVSQYEHYLKDVDNEVVVPVGKKVRFLFTSGDVNHAWWVPDLAVKRDAIPGFINESWARIDKPGVYRGKCAELCGRDHGFMPVVVRAVSEEEYAAWLAAQRGDAAVESAAAEREWTTDELIARGEGVYQTNCASCHQAEGQGISGVFPAIAGSAVANGPAADHLNTVFNGVSGTAMAPFSGQLSDLDIAAVVTYQRNAFGNTAADAVQPATVAGLRN
jgi:cytochrome c oxidase subunit 2